MITISPWINFNGNAEEAFTFYKSVFGGEFTNIIRFKDVADPGFQVAEHETNNIMRITLSINGATVLIGNDVPAFMGKVNEQENRSKIHVAAGNKEEAKKMFDGLSVGGQVEVPLDDSAEDTSFSMFRDQYGIEWVIEFNSSK